MVGSAYCHEGKLWATFFDDDGGRSLHALNLQKRQMGWQKVITPFHLIPQWNDRLTVQETTEMFMYLTHIRFRIFFFFREYLFAPAQFTRTILQHSINIYRNSVNKDPILGDNHHLNDLSVAAKEVIEIRAQEILNEATNTYADKAWFDAWTSLCEEVSRTWAVGNAPMAIGPPPNPGYHPVVIKLVTFLKYVFLIASLCFFFLFTGRVRSV